MSVCILSSSAVYILNIIFYKLSLGTCFAVFGLADNFCFKGSFSLAVKLKNSEGNFSAFKIFTAIG